ncbi:g5541 [Coccomyxa viridis]|uniref:G5541 protein n=1 Tax=Coccomyxa viridis TaxID=1274662 RepID=A0ABP1FZX8_9CHLO
MQEAPALALELTVQCPGVSNDSSIPTGADHAAPVSAEAGQERDKASSRRFTDPQQAVAAALMVVMKHAMEDGREAALAAKQTLVSNNPSTQPFLAMLPDDGPLPSVQHVEQQASEQLLDSLTKLAKQLDAALSQPLEVFSRSAQCTTHKTAMESLASKGRVYERQQRMHQLDQTMARHKRRLTSQGLVMECLQALEQMGVPGALVALTSTFMQTYRLLRDEEYWHEPATEHRADLDQLLPGVLDVLVEDPDADFSRACGLMRLVPSIRAALQAYENRATQPLATHPTAALLVYCIIRAEPRTDPPGTPLLQGSGQLIVATAAPNPHAMETPPERTQLSPNGMAVPMRTPGDPKSLVKAWCPTDVWPILEAVMDYMKLSDPDHMLEKLLNRKEESPKTALLELFEGNMEMLYCAIDPKNADMLDPGELTPSVRSAFQAISARVGPGNVERVYWLKVSMTTNGSANKIQQAGETSASRFWLLRALAQLANLRLYHAEDATNFAAEDALLPGISHKLLDVRDIQKLDCYKPEYPTKQLKSFRKAVHAVEEAVLRQDKAARSLGKSLSTHLTELAGRSRHGGRLWQEDVNYLIAILADRVGPEICKPAISQGPSGRARDASDIRSVIDSGFNILTPDGHATYGALQKVFPGFPAPNSVPEITKPEKEQAAKLVEQQIQVHKHIASLQKRPLRYHLEALWKQQRFEYRHGAGGEFREEVCRAALGITVDIAAAKKMHISMCVKAVLHGSSHASEERHFMVLLDKLASICAENADDSPQVDTISKALPGVWMCLFRLHTWPQGLDKGLKWLHQATKLISDITAQHARAALDKGIQIEEHIRKILAVPGFEDAEVELLVSYFQEVWAALTSKGAVSAPTGTTPANTSTSAEDLGSSALAEGPSAVAQEPGGPSTPQQDMHEAKKPNSGPDKKSLLKTEKKKAKKARQRAAKAQVAAQTAEAAGSESMVPGTAEGGSSAANMELPADVQPTEQAPGAGQISSEALSAAPDNPHSPKTPARSSEASASSRSSSVSPQPSLQLHVDMSHGQLDPYLPGPAAPAAQAAGPATEDEEPWQEVKASRRKPASQQAASKASMSKAPKQGRDAPNWQTSAASQSPSRDLQAAALHAEQTQPSQAPSNNAISAKASAAPQQALHSGLHCGASSSSQAAKEEDQDDENLCVVCWEELRAVIFYNCMHMVTCQGCAKDIMAAGGLCPMCRANIQSTIKTRF